MEIKVSSGEIVNNCPAHPIRNSFPSGSNFNVLPITSPVTPPHFIHMFATTVVARIIKIQTFCTVFCHHWVDPLGLSPDFPTKGRIFPVCPINKLEKADLSDKCFQLPSRRFLSFRFVPLAFDPPPFQLPVPEFSGSEFWVLSKGNEPHRRFKNAS